MRSSPVIIPRSAVRAGAVRSGWIPWEKTIPGVCRALFSRVKSGLRGERTSNKVSEPCRLRRSEGYEVCEDEGAVQKGIGGGGRQWRPLNGKGVQQH